MPFGGKRQLNPFQFGEMALECSPSAASRELPEVAHQSATREDLPQWQPLCGDDVICGRDGPKQHLRAFFPEAFVVQRILEH